MRSKELLPISLCFFSFSVITLFFLFDYSSLGNTLIILPDLLSFTSSKRGIFMLPITFRKDVKSAGKELTLIEFAKLATQFIISLRTVKKHQIIFTIHMKHNFIHFH